MEAENRIRVLSKPQKKLLEAMIDCISVKQAAQKAGFKPRTAYNLLYSLRKKYRRARKFVNTIDAQKRRSKLFKMVLTDRLTAEEKLLDEEEGDYPKWL